MSKKRGMSVEEKRKAMMEIFSETKDIYQLKELEKIAPKMKGIVQGTVKDVLQSLVDDGKVDTDKIGTSIYFWAFPSKAANSSQQKLAELEKKYERIKKVKQEMESKKARANADKQDEELHAKLLSQLKEEQEMNLKLKTKLKNSEGLDPETLTKLKVESNETITAANRWTDNIFQVKSWCKKNFNFEDEQLDKAFGIPSDLDYL